MEYNEEIYSKLAKEHNLDKVIVKEICTAQFRFIADKMEEGKREAVRLPYFGIYRVKPERVLKLAKAGRI